MAVDAATAAAVRERAADRCEYCRMHQSLQGATFHIEHIVPASAGGTSDLDNLALACPNCNLHKSDRLLVPDPDTDEETLLFHPRLHAWVEHLTWDDYGMVGLTATGRATVRALHLNSPRRLLIRQAEQGFGLFPPDR